MSNAVSYPTSMEEHSVLMRDDLVVTLRVKGDKTITVTLNGSQATIGIVDTEPIEHATVEHAAVERVMGMEALASEKRTESHWPPSRLLVDCSEQESLPGNRLYREQLQRHRPTFSHLTQPEQEEIVNQFLDRFTFQKAIEDDWLILGVAKARAMVQRELVHVSRNVQDNTAPFIEIQQSSRSSRPRKDDNRGSLSGRERVRDTDHTSFLEDASSDDGPLSQCKVKNGKEAAAPAKNHKVNVATLASAIVGDVSNALTPPEAPVVPTESLRGIQPNDTRRDHRDERTDSNDEILDDNSKGAAINALHGSHKRQAELTLEGPKKKICSITTKASSIGFEGERFSDTDGHDTASDVSEQVVAVVVHETTVSQEQEPSRLCDTGAPESSSWWTPLSSCIDGASSGSLGNTERIMVYCGGGPHTEPGNVAFQDAALPRVREYINADKDAREAILSEFMQRFAFMRGKSEAPTWFARDKLHKLLSDRRKLPGGRSAPTPKKRNLERANILSTASSGSPGNTERIKVYCGPGHHTEPGNVAFHDAALSRVREYIKADNDAKEAILSEFMQRFAFMQGKSEAPIWFVRDKLSKLLSDRKKLPSDRSARTPKKKNLERANILITSCSPLNGRGHDIPIAPLHPDANGKSTVFCGLQPRLRQYPGNKVYLQRVSDLRRSYLASSGVQKHSIISEFLDLFQFQRPAYGGTWNTATDQWARDKVHMALCGVRWNAARQLQRGERDATTRQLRRGERDATLDLGTNSQWHEGSSQQVEHAGQDTATEDDHEAWEPRVESPNNRVSHGASAMERPTAVFDIAIPTRHYNDGGNLCFPLSIPDAEVDLEDVIIIEA